MPDRPAPPEPCTCRPAPAEVGRLIAAAYRAVDDLAEALATPGVDAGPIRRRLAIDLDNWQFMLGLDGFPERRVEGGGLKPPPPVVPFDPAHAATDEPGRLVLDYTGPTPIRVQPVAGSLIPQPAAMAEVLADEDHLARIEREILAMPPVPDGVVIAFDSRDADFELSDDFGPIVRGGVSRLNRKGESA